MESSYFLCVVSLEEILNSQNQIVKIHLISLAEFPAFLSDVEREIHHLTITNKKNIDTSLFVSPSDDSIVI